MAVAIGRRSGRHLSPQHMVTQPVVAVLAVHPQSVAATRLRAVQYRHALSSVGLQFELWSFLRERDLVAWYGTSHLRRVAVVLRAVWRLPAAVACIRRASVVIVQREAMPLGPPLIEMLAARLRPVVWDVDDAVWESYVSPTAGRVPRWVRATADKSRRICASADQVWAGSEVLASWCRQHNDAVSVVPTVVSVPETLPTPTAERTIGWVGSHSTGEFISGILPALASISPSPRMRIVGADPSPPPGLDADIQPWSPAAEASLLAGTRVGVYPVDREHPLAEGKCGLKAILFMAHGIPCVVTPTTTNATVVRAGIDGLHARTPEEWTVAVQRLLDDHDLWQRCREAGHERARSMFSLDAWGPWVCDQLLALTNGGAR